MTTYELNTDDKHVCMLPQEPKYFDIPPTAGYHRHLLCKIRELMLPSDWHHGSLEFLRSQRRLQLERGRQVALRRWLLWHPYSAAAYYWDCFMLTLMYAAFLYMPLQVFHSCPNRYDLFILSCDGFAFLHICTRFITGVDPEDGSQITLNPKDIAKKYLYGAFVFDLIAALPLQFIEFFENCKYPTHTVWLVLKLFRLVSLRKQWRNVYKQLGLSYVAASVITVFSRFIIFYHWLTYVNYQVPTIFVHYYSETDPKPNNWFERLRVKKDDDETPFQKYTSNLFYVCGLCNGAGSYSPVDETLVPEMLLNSFLGMLGLLFFTYTFTTLWRLAIYSRFEVFLYNGRLKELSEYMIFKCLPKSLQEKINLFLNYKFYEHYFNEQAILATINEQMKQDINMHCCKRLVMNVPLFQEMPVALINTIIFSLVQMLYMPGEVVVKYDQPGQSIYLIASGTVAVINSNGREVAHLRDGAYFGETALLNPGMLRSATIIALEITEMYKLTAAEFQSCLQPYPHLKRRLDEASLRRASAVRRRRSERGYTR